ncbi:MAG: DUF1634 domain-containing protein [bacterium]
MSRSDKTTRQAIGWVLQIGAWAGTLLMAVGILLLVTMAPEELTSKYFIEHPERIFREILIVPSGVAYISVGLLLLVLTPLVRLLAAAIGFGKSRDWKFMGISLGVLAVILIAVVLGFKGVFLFSAPSFFNPFFSP